jgi:hypothetical protein
MSREAVRDGAMENLEPEGKRGKEAETGDSGRDCRGLRRERSIGDVEFFVATMFLNALHTIPKRSTKGGWKNWEEVQKKSRF